MFVIPSHGWFMALFYPHYLFGYYTTKLFQFVDPTFLFSTPPPAQEWAQEWAQEAWPALLRPVMKTGYQPSLMVIKQDKLPMDPNTV